VKLTFTFTFINDTFRLLAHYTSLRCVIYYKCLAAAIDAETDAAAIKCNEATESSLLGVHACRMPRGLSL